MGGFRAGLIYGAAAFFPAIVMQQASTSAYGHSDLGVNGPVTNSAATGCIAHSHRHREILMGIRPERVVDALWPERLVYRCRAAGHVLQRGRDHAIRSVARQQLWLHVVSGSRLSRSAAFGAALRA